MSSAILLHLERMLAAEDERPLTRPLRAGLSALALVYRGLYEADRLPYRLGLRRVQCLGIPVIGVGNLAVGGTGKTPSTIWLARKLAGLGLRPAVVSHGYRGEASAPLVVSAGDGLEPPALAGDEARLVALSCPGVPVVAGRDRVAAARLALRTFAPLLCIADDAFQYRRLARDLDLVLLDAVRPFGNGRLLPRGWLREPKGALRRADVVVLVGENNGRPSALPADLPVFRAAVCPVSLTKWQDWRRGARQPIGRDRGRAAAFCGLARPERFRATLTGLGWTVTDWLTLPDHVSPAPAVFQAWLGRGKGPIITTEKDAVKLTPTLTGVLADAGRELWVLGVEFIPEDERGLLAFVLAACGLRGGGGE